MEDIIEQLRLLSPEDRAVAMQEFRASPDPPAGPSGQPDRVVVTQQSYFNRKLRLFSGKSPVPSGEVDFETWRLQVRQLDHETDLDANQTRRIILQSLLRPALDSVVTADTTVEILQILDNIYGSVVDGAELLLKFQTTYQNEKESDSSYLQRLYHMGLEIASKDTITHPQVPMFLIKQFIRGSQDDDLIQKLRLEDKVEDPPSFAELLLSIRKEEARRSEKKLRLKSSKTATVAHVEIKSKDLTSISTKTSVIETPEVQELKQRVSLLEAQLTQQTYQLPPPTQYHQSASPQQQPYHSATGGFEQNPTNIYQPQSDTKHQTNQRKKPFPQNRSNRWKSFCYKCGQDFHHIPDCPNESNPVLVQQKLLQRFHLNK